MVVVVVVVVIVVLNVALLWKRDSLGAPAKWNLFAGDSTEVEFTCWGLERGGIHLMGTPARERD